LTTRILPPAAILVPLFVVVQTVQATNSLFAVAVVLGASNVPLAAWLMRQFIVDIPGNLMDALRVDGGGEWALIRWLIVPIAGSGFAAALFLSFVLAWNDYLFTSVLIASPDLKTLPVIAADFVTGYKIKWGLMLACDVVLIIPPVVLSVIAAPQIARIVLRTTKN
jgi:ABC-type glycerol-3-phosphate transport system permease component